jgi:dCMP deaminase
MASRVLLEKESPDIDMEKVFAEHYRNMLEGFKKASPAQRGVISQLSDSLTDFLQGDAPRERPSKMEIAMRTAFLAAEGSTCNKLQVGAVLTDQDYAVVSSGFNGTPSGFPHCCDVYTYEEHTAKHDIHAEVNAIERCKWLPNQDEHSCLFVTHLPCMSCAKTIVAAKRRLNIKKVIFGEVYDNDDPTYEKYQSVEDIKTFLRQAGIELIAAVG